MTKRLLDFIDKLPRDGWEFNQRCLRRNDHCPIEVVGGTHPGAFFTVLPDALGLSRGEFDMILDAADGRGQPGLRAALLAHVGLEEAA